MPRFKRTDRINEQLRQEIAVLVRDAVRDPRVGLATVTAVETSPELDHAKVYVTTLGDEKEREDVMVGLRSAAPFVRSQLARRLSMRRIPELHFEYDRVLEEAQKIERLLREALPADAPAAEGDDGAEARLDTGADVDTGSDVDAVADSDLDFDSDADADADEAGTRKESPE